MTYDDNWISYSMYVVCTVESNANYGAIEPNGVGIGIAQWSNSRSYELLQKLVTDYPQTLQSLPSLAGEIGEGTNPWDSKIFYQQQLNEISAVLVTDEGVATQDALYSQDCNNSYIPILRDKCHITNAKGAIYGLSIYHQSPQAFYQVYNAVGNQDYNVWYQCALNNGIVGKYKNRQNTVKQLLDNWDGTSGAPGFGVKHTENEIGGNNNPNAGNPDDTYEYSIGDFDNSYIKKVGNELWLKVHTSSGYKTVTFYLASDGNMWYAHNGRGQSGGESTTVPVPDIPQISGESWKIQRVVDIMVSFEGKNQYSQSASLRANPPGGYSDCSGLYWYCYNQVGVEVGTWTGQQGRNGIMIAEGSGNLPEEQMQLGDAILIMWRRYNADFDHIEMYIGNGTCMGHGSGIGPTRKNMNNYVRNAFRWQIRRYIQITTGGDSPDFSVTGKKYDEMRITSSRYDGAKITANQYDNGILPFH